MRKGLSVTMARECRPFYRSGDKGILSMEERHGWWVNFNECGNTVVAGDGVWHVPLSDIILAPGEDPEDTLP